MEDCEHPARLKVLSTPELLECMLSRLPCRDAISARRVCTAWRDNFNTSPLLRKGCFLQPQSAPLDLTGVWVVGDSQYTNEILKSWRARSDAACELKFLETASSQDLTPAVIYRNLPQNGGHVLNPLLKDVVRFYNPTHRRSHYHLAEKLGKPCPDYAWTSMLVSQPPTTCMVIKAPESVSINPNSLFHGHDLGKTLARIDKTSGITIADLVSAVQTFEGHAHIQPARYTRYAGILEYAHDGNEVA